MKKFIKLGKSVVGIAILIALGVACRTEPDHDYESFRVAMSKTPLPPGITEYEIHGDDFERSFYVSAQNSDVTENDIIAFYQAYFDENGWVDNLSAAEEADGMLDYVKGRESIHVTTTDVLGQLHLMVIYQKYDHTREEFDALVKESAEPDALQIVELVNEAYGRLASYRDSGVLEEADDDEKSTTAATFKTYFVSPDRFRFSYSEPPESFFPTAYELAMRGTTVTSMASFDEDPEVGDDVSHAIAGLYGVTSSTSGNIPELFLSNDSTLFHLIHLTVIEEGKLDDGTNCLGVQGTNFLGEQETIWVGKADHLIRRIESNSGLSDWSRITYQPEANVEIDSQVFEFRPPAV